MIDYTTPKKLTKAQAEVIWCLRNWGYLDNPADLEPADIFPDHNNRDNARRRTMGQMALTGYFTKAPGWPAGARVYRANRAAIDPAWNEWHKSVNFTDPGAIFGGW